MLRKILNVELFVCMCLCLCVFVVPVLAIKSVHPVIGKVGSVNGKGTGTRKGNGKNGQGYRKGRKTPFKIIKQQGLLKKVETKLYVNRKECDNDESVVLNAVFTDRRTRMSCRAYCSGDVDGIIPGCRCVYDVLNEDGMKILGDAKIEDCLIVARRNLCSLNRGVYVIDDLEKDVCDEPEDVVKYELFGAVEAKKKLDDFRANEGKCDYVQERKALTKCLGNVKVRERTNRKNILEERERLEYEKYGIGKAEKFFNDLYKRYFRVFEDKVEFKKEYGLWNWRNVKFLVPFVLLIICAYMATPKRAILCSVGYFITTALWLVLSECGLVFSIGYAALGGFSLIEAFSYEEVNHVIFGLIIAGGNVFVHYMDVRVAVVVEFMLMIMFVVVMIMYIHNAKKVISAVRGVVVLMMMSVVFYEFVEKMVEGITGVSSFTNVVLLMKVLFRAVVAESYCYKSSWKNAVEIVRYVCEDLYEIQTKQGFIISVLICYVVVYVVRLKIYYTFLTRELNLYTKEYEEASYVVKQYCQMENTFEAILDVIRKFKFKDFRSLYISIMRLFYMGFLVSVIVLTHVEFFIISVLLWIMNKLTMRSRSLYAYNSFKEKGIKFEDLKRVIKQNVTVHVRQSKGNYLQGIGVVDGEDVKTVEHLNGIKGGEILVNNEPVRVVNKVVTVKAEVTEENKKEGFVKDANVRLVCNKVLGERDVFEEAEKSDLEDVKSSVVMFSKNSGTVMVTKDYEIVVPYVKYKLDTKPGDSGSGIYVLNEGRLYSLGNHSQADESREGWSVGILNSGIAKEIRKLEGRNVKEKQTLEEESGENEEKEPVKRRVLREDDRKKKKKVYVRKTKEFVVPVEIVKQYGLKFQFTDDFRKLKLRKENLKVDFESVDEAKEFVKETLERNGYETDYEKLNLKDLQLVTVLEKVNQLLKPEKKKL